MEARNITVVSTRDQKRTVVSTDATTLAELKAALRAANVDYNDMTFYEGLTHTEILTDDAILPHDVPYKGTTTNELVFMLTNPNKKIKSGALSDARAALYSTIMEKNLGDRCVAKYGKNMTNCSNAELLSLVEEVATEESSNTPCEVSPVEEAFRALVDVLYDDDLIDDFDRDHVLSFFHSVDEDSASSYSDSEIFEMFNFIR